jgi:hypothetical protein
LEAQCDLLQRRSSQKKLQYFGLLFASSICFYILLT